MNAPLRVELIPTWAYALAAAPVAALLWVYLARAVRRGTVTVRGKAVRSDLDPLGFWLFVGWVGLFAVGLTGVLVRTAVDAVAGP